jgi:hypothetical protein
MNEPARPRNPDEIVRAIWDAEDDTAVIDIEREVVEDTAEEDPGEVEDDGYSGSDARRRQERRS